MRTFTWKDRSTWPIYLGEEPVYDRDIDDKFVELFLGEYSHVTVYHASRPLNPETIMIEGLSVASYESIIESYVKNVAQYCNIELQEDHLAYAKEKIGYFHNGSLFVVLNDEDLLAYAGHYAIYGSEYLVGITNRISQEYGTIELDCLKRFGKPTVYEILLPLNFLTYEDVSCLVREINNYKCTAEVGEDIDFTFELYRHIPSEHVVSYYHPNNIPDPMKQFIKYVHDDS